jgi:hypothetical protein
LWCDGRSLPLTTPHHSCIPALRSSGKREQG